MVSAKATKKKGVAKKGTHSKKKKIAPKDATVVHIDAKAKYGIDQIGPLLPGWAKRNKKNSKGKMVKEWYLKKPSKWRIWTKWNECFMDEHEKDEDYRCTWSAEDQKLLAENSANKAAIEKAIADKFVWPWLKRDDEDYDKRLKLLLAQGYKEWKPKGSKEKKTANKWQMRFAIEPKTDTGSNSSGDTSDSDSATTDTAEADEEEDDEV